MSNRKLIAYINDDPIGSSQRNMDFGLLVTQVLGYRIQIDMH